MLAEKGLKNTSYRQFLLKLLEEAKVPLSVEELYLRIKKDKPKVSLSTVYRAMDTLSDKRLAKKTTLLDDGVARYEFNTKEHKHHLVCLGCSEIIAISDCPFTCYKESIENETGFLVQGHKLELYGYCPVCKKLE